MGILVHALHAIIAGAVAYVDHMQVGGHEAGPLQLRPHI